MAAGGYRAKIKNFRNTVFYKPLDPKFHTKHFFRKKTYTENN